MNEIIKDDLKELSVEAREIENVMKNYKLGKWGLGQTRALYKYDQHSIQKQSLSDTL